MVKYRLYYNKERMAAFLDEMSRKGYAMTGFFAGLFTFDRCSPGEYMYQIDITQGFFRVSNDYREFMEEVDVEIVCLWGPWAILRKKAADGPFVLYTDVASAIQQYTRIRKLFKIALLLEMIALIMELWFSFQGSTLALAVVFLIAAVGMAMSRELMRINGILAELKSRQGLEPDGKSPYEGKGFSGFLTLGFLLNALGFGLRDTGPDSEFWKGFFHGLAIVFFLAGLMYIWWKMR